MNTGSDKHHQFQSPNLDVSISIRNVSLQTQSKEMAEGGGERGGEKKKQNISCPSSAMLSSLYLNNFH